MIEIEKQIQETELEQQALAAKASKQRIDLMDKIRVVMKVNVLKYNNSSLSDCRGEKIASHPNLPSGSMSENFLQGSFLSVTQKLKVFFMVAYEYNQISYLLVDLLFCVMNLE